MQNHERLPPIEEVFPKIFRSMAQEDNMDDFIPILKVTQGLDQNKNVAHIFETVNETDMNSDDKETIPCMYVTFQQGEKPLVTLEPPEATNLITNEMLQADECIALKIQQLRSEGLAKSITVNDMEHKTTIKVTYISESDEDEVQIIEVRPKVQIIEVHPKEQIIEDRKLQYLQKNIKLLKKMIASNTKKMKMSKHEQSIMKIKLRLFEQEEEKVINQKKISDLQKINIHYKHELMKCHDLINFRHRTGQENN